MKQQPMQCRVTKKFNEYAKRYKVAQRQEKEKCGYELYATNGPMQWRLMGIDLRQDDKEKEQRSDKVVAESGCHQPDGTAKANILGFSGCVT